MTTTSRIYDLARAMLDAIVANWPTDTDLAAALPARRYVSFGTPAWDCEQVVVGPSRLYSIEADPSLEGLIAWKPLFANNAVEMNVQIIRCQPTGDGTNPPSTTQLETIALAVHQDIEVVRQVLVDAQQNGSLATPSGLSFGNWNSLGPQGGLGGGSQVVRLATF